MSDGSAQPPLVVLQVLPPVEGGVRDYALALQARWAAGGQDSQMLVLSRERAARTPLHAEWPACPGRAGSPAAVMVVVLHFSGYGYERRGLCFWLLAQMQGLRRRHPEVRLVVVFHELFASGPPWRSAFWLAGMQRLIARRLVALADAVWTNTDGHGRWIRRHLPVSRPMCVYPVFSNVGEPGSRRPAAGREPTMVVFGAASTRARAIRLLARSPALLQGLGVQAVVEVGPGPRSAGPLPAVEHTALGRLDVPDLVQLLQRCRFGLIDYPPPYLAKSSVLATYATHGCVVVNTCSDGPDTDGLRRGLHYLLLDGAEDGPVDATRCQQLADSLHRWYAGHALQRQADELAGLLRGP